MRHILGIDESIDITGRSCLDFFTPESRERIRQEMATRSQGVRSNYEARIQRPDGEVREVVIYAAPIISDGALNSLIATFMDVTELKRAQIEREELIGVLQATLTKVKLLSGFLPICASCKKIRNDRGYWQQVESYIAEHSEAEFSHGICPDCVRKYYPELNRDDPPESPDTSAEDPEEPDDFTGSRKP